jgi:hypothetical protein
VRQWRIEAAEQRQALARQVLPAGRIPQVHRDALFALRSAADASEGLARPPQWGWVAMDPESTWLLAIDVGDRPRAMVQRVGHQGA